MQLMQNLLHISPGKQTIKLQACKRMISICTGEFNYPQIIYELPESILLKRILLHKVCLSIFQERSINISSLVPVKIE